MPRFLRILNWLSMALFGASLLFVVLVQPSSAILGAAYLIPCGSALMAARAGSRRGAWWAAAAFNGLGALLVLGIVGAAILGQADQPMLAAVAGLVVAVPCGFNWVFFWRRLRVSRST